MTARLPYIIGQDNKIAIQKPTAEINYDNNFVSYTKPDLKPLYSHHGFAIPLSQNNLLPYMLHVNYADLLDRVIHGCTTENDFTLILNTSLTWIVIDHKEHKDNCLYVRMFLVDDKDKKIYYIDQEIARDKERWWISDGSTNGSSVGISKKEMIGFLYTNPTVKQINDFVFKHNTGHELLWLDIDDIRAKLIKDYT